MNNQLNWLREKDSEGTYHVADTGRGHGYTIRRDAKLGRCVLKHEYLDEDVCPCIETLGKGTLIAMKDKARQHYAGLVANLDAIPPDLDDDPEPLPEPASDPNPDEPLPPLPKPAGCPCDEENALLASAPFIPSAFEEAERNLRKEFLGNPFGAAYMEERAMVLNAARPADPEPAHDDDDTPPQPEPCNVGRFTLPDDPDAPPVTPEDSEGMSHLALTARLARRLIRCGCSTGTAAAVFGQLSKRGARKLRKALHALGAVHLAAAPRTAAA